MDHHHAGMTISITLIPDVFVPALLALPHGCVVQRAMAVKGGAYDQAFDALDAVVLRMMFPEADAFDIPNPISVSLERTSGATYLLHYDADALTLATPLYEEQIAGCTFPDCDCEGVAAPADDVCCECNEEQVIFVEDDGHMVTIDGATFLCVEPAIVGHTDDGEPCVTITVAADQVVVRA